MLNVAILGTGAVADSHIQAYLRWPDRCRLAALVDLDPVKAQQKAARFGLNIPVFADLAALLASNRPDLASVCLPPFAHAPATIDLLRAGAHVLVEKPMATSLGECDAMLGAARDSGRLLSVVAQNRFKTPMMRLKHLLETGLAGRILHAAADSLWWRGGRYYDLWWRGTWEKEGGGCTMNHAVHHIDLFHWMMGMPATVQALTLNLAHENSEVEDFATAILTYPEGAVGQITASLVHHGEEQQLVFHCERARVSVPWRVEATCQKENGFPEKNAGLESQLQARYEELAPLALEGHDGQIANMLDAVEGRGPLLIDGHAGRRTLELVTAIYQSSHRGERVRLPLTPSDPFYSREGILRTARHFHEKTHSVRDFGTNEITLGRNYGR